ncbi:MAG TPA: hypothetical protein VFW73_03875, partial [Lacipirellulaceae bacterium]|nr:hypothetical protein [Lacipirellulaceae bacterium]
EIVRRARDAKADASRSESLLLGDTMPKIRIFGSPRAWIWAALAVAAGLLIMFFQSDNKRANNLPQVAQHTDRELTEQPTGEVDAPSLRAPAQSESEANRIKNASSDDLAKLKVEKPVAPMPTQQVEHVRESLSGNSPMSAPIASASPAPKTDVDKSHAATGSRTTSSLSSNEVDKLAMPPQSTGRATALGGAVSGPTAKKAPTPESPNQSFVVHVVAKREAIQNKSFDRLLASHGIDFVSDSPKDQSQINRSRAFRKQAPEIAIKLADKSGEEQGADFVLVEAPKPTIISCLASLNKDSANYLGINVDQSTAAHDRASEKLAPDNKIADDLSKYSRGVAPQQQASADLYGRYEYHAEAPAAGAAGPAATAQSAAPNFVGGGGQSTASRNTASDGKQGTSEIQSFSFARRSHSQPQETKIQQDKSQRSGLADNTTELRRLGELKTRPEPQQTVKDLTPPHADELRVLFVLSPEQSAPSPPLDNQTK